jgi:hypothetical protein
MDLNFKRRGREQRIAVDVAEQFMRETRSSEVAAPELLAHHLGLVFQPTSFPTRPRSRGCWPMR